MVDFKKREKPDVVASVREEKDGQEKEDEGQVALPLPFLVSEAKAILAEAIEREQPSHVFGLFSGGYDSLCATDVASQHPQFSGAVHINTGIGIEETREYVRSTSATRGWPLIELYPPDRTYDDLVMEFGFPGPAAHNFMYRYLKERAVRLLVRQHKSHARDRIVLVTGVRRQESQRRMGTVDEVKREGAQVWVAPILNWSALDRFPYMEQRGLPRNRVVDFLHMSGECLCGAYAHPDELDEVRCWFPKTARRIEHLQRCAAMMGVHAQWGKRPPNDRSPRIVHSEDFFESPLCWTCDARVEERTTT